MRAARTLLMAAAVCLLPTPSPAQTGTVTVTFGSLGTKTCGAALSTTATLTNSSVVNAAGTIVLNGGPSTAFNVPGGGTVSVVVPGGTLDCSKAPDLVATVSVGGSLKGAYTITKTLAADSVTLSPQQQKFFFYNSSAATVVVPSAAKCGSLVELSAIYQGIYGGALPAITYTLGTQTPQTTTLVLNGTVRFTIASSLACGTPIPKFSYKLTGNATIYPVLAAVTYK